MADAAQPSTPEKEQAAPASADAPTTQAPEGAAAPDVIVEAPAVAPSEVAESAPPETFLNIEPAKVEEKPAEAPKTEVKPEDKAPEPAKDEAAKVEPPKEEAQSEKPAQAPTYDAFVLPDGVKIDDAALSEFTSTLGEFETTSKADHAEVQKLGQKFLDKYVAESQKNVQRIQEYYTAEWEKQKSEWKTQLEADPEIGGNRIQTTKASISQALSKAPAEHVKAFSEYMNASGIGNNPAVVRMFAYLSEKLNRYEQETARPIAGTKPPAPKTSIYETFYGKKSG